MTEPEESAGSASANEDSKDRAAEQFTGPATENSSENIPEEFKEPIVEEVTDVLDLHIFRPRDVGEVVRTYLEEARKKNFSAVRIIHGKGIGTQREIVRSILSKTSFVTSYGDAPGQEGGWGATIAWLSN